MEKEYQTQYTAELIEYSKLSYYDKLKQKNYIEYRDCHKDCTWEEVITYVNIGLDHEFYTNIHPIIHPDILTVLVNKYNQLPSDYIPRDLEVIEAAYNPSGLLLRRETRFAFEIMCREAARTGIHLEAISTFRSFPYQKQVYMKNYTPNITLEAYQAIRDTVSARPGHSEHQTGMAVDINDLEQTFEDTAAGKWLAMNSFRYGFILRYPKGKEYITGYDYEPWHFRYMGQELSKAVRKSGLTYDEYYVRFLSVKEID